MIVDLNQLKAPQIICLGEALLDRLGPLGGDLFLDNAVEDCLGGAPANVACGLAKLGTEVAFVGRLGEDAIGKHFQHLFQVRGVHSQGIQIDERRPSRVVLVRRDLRGERSFQGFKGGEDNGFADQALSLNDLKKVWPCLVLKARWLLIGTIPLSTSNSSESLLWSVDEALKKDIQLAIDINWRPTFWDPKNDPDSGPNKVAIAKISPLLEKASLLKLAKEEAKWFFNTSEPCQISRLLPKHPDVVVTDGARPLHWCIGGFSGEMCVFSPLSVVDTTGAGDAFTAGLLHQFLLSTSMQMKAEAAVEEMVRFAAACGALVCGGAGAINPQPTYEEVKKFLFDSIDGNK